MTQSRPFPTTVLPFLWLFMRPKLPVLAVIVSCPVVWAVVTTLNPFLLKTIIDTVIGFTGDVSEIWSVAWMPVAIFTGLLVFLDVAMRLEEYLIVRTIPKMKAEIRLKMFDYVQQHSHGYFQDRLAGTLSNKVLDMVRAFENMFGAVVRTFFPILLNCLISAGLLLTVHWCYSVFVILWFATYVGMTVFFSQRCIAFSDAHSEANSVLSGRIVDAFRNIITVRLFARRQRENQLLDKYQDEEIARAQRLGMEMLKVHLFQGAASLILLSVALVMYINMWQKGLVTVGDFTFVTSTTFSLMILAWWMAEQFTLFFKELGIARQALSMINITHDVKDHVDAQPLCVDGGSISFDSVSFSYIDGKNIFDDRSLLIAGGERIGLVGFSGSGKTTFISLILRYFDVHTGQIIIDGQDIRVVTQESLRDNIAVIPQDPSLFHRTLMENIRYGRLDASDEEVIAAAMQARCHEFICELPEGYDSLVGEGGIKLSGGQRQRIAIARAILKNAPILILDEATSALDSVTERRIQHSLEKAMEGRTTIVIAHRLSTLSMLDRILVFDEGVIVEDGNHDVLLAIEGHYAGLWHMQTDGFLPEKNELNTTNGVKRKKAETMQ
ncbi:Uncharacterized ABC transporter ATP-binding protein HI_1051 [Chlamydiales bacterium SCGC AG-110-P3]|nr:Uncharacterized ABC transporter ATP-binding protein HI_1051 [Chlamydiales bacterium SCGC AG-110-P3]